MENPDHLAVQITSVRRVDEGTRFANAVRWLNSQ